MHCFLKVIFYRYIFNWSFLHLHKLQKRCQSPKLVASIIKFLMVTFSAFLATFKRFDSKWRICLG